MNRIINILLAVLAALAIASCQLRPLEDPDESIKIQVQVELKAIANVTESIYNEKIPVPEISTDMVRVMFYNPVNGRLVSQGFISEKDTAEDGSEVLSGEIKIVPGTYNMVCYNFDTANTLVKNESNYEDITAYTSEVNNTIKSRYASRADLKDQTINYEPDHLVVAREPNLVISPHTGLLVIETEAVTCVDTYYLQVHVTGMQYAASASAVITGMSPSNKFALDERNYEEPSALFFELQKSTDSNIAGSNKDVLCTLFNTFGKIPESTSNLFITFNVVTTSGETKEYSFPMDDVFKTEDAIERHWLLLDYTIDVPVPTPTPSTGGGFTPVVDDWDDEHADITL